MIKTVKAAVVTLSALILMLCVGGNSHARITGTNPTGSSADAFNVGKVSAEVAVDYLGDFLPTVNNAQSLGTSSFAWSNVYATTFTANSNITATGTFYKTMVATQAVTAGATIDPTTSCGGILRLSAVANVTTDTTNTFTAPSALNTGCVVYVVNTGGGIISLDTNTNFPTFGFPSIGNIDLGTNDSVIIGSLGTKWILFGTVTNN